MRSRIGIALFAGVLAVAACGPEVVDDAAENTDLAPGVTLGFELETTVSLPSSTVVETTTSSSVATSSDTGSTTSLPAPTTTVNITTTSTTTPSACSSGAVPAGEESDHVGIDVDGDGVNEMVYASRFEAVWMIIVEFSGDQYAAMPVVDAELFDGVRVVGGAPFGGGASEDIVFTMTGGAYTSLIAFARTDGCEVERLTNEDGLAMAFLSGASIANFSGVHCSAGSVQQYFFELAGEDGQGNPFFEGGFTPYNLEGLSFVEFPSDATILSLDELQAVGTFECFGLSL